MLNILGLLLLFSPIEKERGKIVIISIDGLRPEFYLSEDYNCPNLKKYIKLGVYAEKVVSVYPSITYPAHASIVTGVNPDKHQVYSNSFLEASSIKSKTLWDIAAKKDLKTASISWPSTIGAKIDLLIPEIPSDDQDKKKHLELIVKHSTKGLIFEIMANIGKVDLSKMDDPIEIDKLIALATNYILKKHDPDLTLVHVISVDTISHKHGKDSKELKNALKQLDETVSSIVDTATEKKSTIIILGDHGFKNISKSFLPNVLLRQNDLLDKAMVKSCGAIGFITLSDKNSKDKVLKLFKEKAGKYGKVIEDLKPLNTWKEAIAALEPLDGYMISDLYIDGNKLIDDLVVDSKMKSHHGHLPDQNELYTGFIAFSGKISAKAKIEKIKLVDVAPTVCKLMNLSSEGMDGEPIKEIVGNN